MAKADIAVDVISAKIAKLELKPGDVLAVRFPHRLTLEDIERAKEIITAALPDTKHLILGENVELLVIDPPATEATQKAAN